MKLIDWVLRLYPAEFRRRFGREMREFHDARVREQNVPVARIVADHLASAVREQLRAVGPDVRYALRSLAARPGFAAVVILTVALGVGANGAVFSIVNGVLLRALPYPQADRLIAFRHEPTQWLVSEPQYEVYRDRLKAFESFAAFTTSEATIIAGTDPERIAISSVTPNFFKTLGVQPTFGRTFIESDVVRPSHVVLLSHGLWTRRFNADSSVVGQTLRMNGINRTVIGVMPAGFQYPNARIDVWLPICSQRTCASLTTAAPNDADGWANHYLSTVGRLRPGDDIDDARREATGIARQIMRDHSELFDPATPLTPHLRTVRDELVGAARPYLIGLFGAVAFVLLIVCANVANLLLARGSGRQRELAVRAAIGASRRRIMIQLLTESLVMSLIGGAAGLAFAWGGTRLLVSFAPESLPRLDQIRVDRTVVFFSLGISALAGIIFGLVPAVRLGAHTPADVLRSAGKGGGQVSGSARTRAALVVAEIALAVVLLTGAGMLVRSLAHLQRTDIGFRPAGALTAQVSLSGNPYDDDAVNRFFGDLLQRVRAISGVKAAGAARWLPVVDAGGLWDIRIEGRTFPPGQGPAAVPQEVTPGFFAALGMTILRGRDFTDADRVGAPLVGIVKDMQARGPGDVPEPSMYQPYAQASRSGYYVSRSMSLVVRTDRDPLTLATPIRAAVAATAAGVPVSRVRTLASVVGTATDNRRFSTTLLANFALLALFLTSIGIYGVMSYAVSERTFEMGVRIALGAEGSRVLSLVLGDGAKLAITGIIIGLAGAAALSHWIRSLLVDVPAIDVATMAIVAVTLCAVALAASLVPAWRATRVDPVEALRAG